MSSSETLVAGISLASRPVQSIMSKTEPDDEEELLQQQLKAADRVFLRIGDPQKLVCALRFPCKASTTGSTLRTHTRLVYKLSQFPDIVEALQEKIALKKMMRVDSQEDVYEAPASCSCLVPCLATHMVGRRRGPRGR